MTTLLTLASRRWRPTVIALTGGHDDTRLLVSVSYHALNVETGRYE